MRKMLIFIAGTKGGVGKSFASLMLASAAMDLELPLTVYDTDNENRTVSELLGEHCQFLDEQHATYPLDAVINSLYEDSPAVVTIVDMKAGTSRSTQEWFSSVPWEALRKIDVDVHVAGCLTSDPDSVRTFVPWFDYFRKIDFPVHYLVVKNEKDGDDFFACTTLLEPAMRILKLNYMEFLIPPIEQEYINTLNNHNITLRRYLHENPPEILPTIMQKSRLRNHYLAITDPFIDFYASKMTAEDRTDSRKRLIASAQKRIALRKGASESVQKSTVEPKGK